MTRIFYGVCMVMSFAAFTASAEDVTIHCTYDGMYHHTVFNNPAMNKPDEVVRGDFYLTFNNSDGHGVQAYFWGERPRDFSKRSHAQEGPVALFAVDLNQIVISKYTNLYKDPDETVDRKTGAYSYADTYGDGSRRARAAGSCSRTTLRPIPGNRF